jgi:HSP20 family protein
MYKSRFFSDPYFIDLLDLVNETPGFISRTIKRTNVVDDDNEYQIEVAVPGLIKDDISINVKDRVLTIEHERDEEETFRFTNSFIKEYSLPDDVSVKGITAKVENGVLLVTLPKVKKKNTERTIEID